jgi:hypothetical protein
MQATLGKFFKPMAGKESRLEMHDFLFEKERADEVKRMRQEEQAELGEPSMRVAFRKPGLFFFFSSFFSRHVC